MFNHMLRPIARNLIRSGTRSSSLKAADDIKLATLNDIPASYVPWKERYDAKQKVYNIQLIAGIAVLVGTIAYIKITDAIFFNWGPPEEPVENK